MISRRLTNTQKAEILEAYKSGDTTNLIAKNYNCTPNTINRTVKTLLSDNEYSLLKKNRSKISNKNEQLVNNKIVKDHQPDLNHINSITSKNEEIKHECSHGQCRRGRTTEPGTERRVEHFVRAIRFACCAPPNRRSRRCH